ncbi:hypothetical protein ACGFMM_09015 [Streptomyces sp. NPDC048604]|uniref:hypothetical protein n=1 Tax=Streptomyces sp. NPDC048604 TaxID=3365578 RepID=UPI00371CA9E3
MSEQQTEALNETKDVSEETPETPETPEASKTSEASEAPEAAETPEAPKTPETPAASEAPETPAASETPETSETSEAPEPVAPPVAPAPPRRTLRAVLRWTAAVLVFAGLGTGTAMGITAMERTDVPGLATESDGRWAYPKLSLPALPAGVPRPYTEGNDGEIHHADLRKLLLPAPAGATPDPKLNGGWATTEQYLATYPKESAAKLRQPLADSALRHIASRGWTAPDGTVARIHLLRFNSVAFAEAYKDEALDTGGSEELVPAGVETWEVSDTLSGAIRVPFTSEYAYDETEPYGAEQTRWAYVQAGDTLGLIVLSRKGGAPEVPFQQTVTLQTQLLG